MHENQITFVHSWVNNPYFKYACYLSLRLTDVQLIDG